MKIKNILMASMLMLGFVSASAQEEAAEYETVFTPHWYGQAMIGAQYTEGEVSFSDLLSPNAQLAVGYNFNPFVGVRGNVNFWQSRAGWSGKETTAIGKYKWKWNYAAPAVDLTLNLSNIFMGNFNPHRVFNLHAYIGGGLNIAWGNSEANDIAIKMQNDITSQGLVLYSADKKQNLSYLWDGTKCRLFGQAGLIADFMLTENLALDLELQYSFMNDHYNSKRAGNPDMYYNALVGIKYNFGSNYSRRKIERPEPQIIYQDRVVEKVVQTPCPDVTYNNTVEGQKTEKIRRDIFFVINGRTIRSSETQKVQDIVDYMKAHPNAVVTVTGYADKGTGTAAINKRLAANRAKVVTDTLKKKGVPASRIKTDSKGDTEQPFAENDKNRVTICIAE